MRWLCGWCVASILAAQPTAAGLYEQALQANDRQEAIRLLRLSIAAGETFEAHYRLGVALNQQKRYAEAMTELREAFRLTRPEQLADRAHVLFRRSEAAEGLGEVLEAKQLLEMSLGYEDHPRVRAKLRELQERLAETVIPAEQIRAAVLQATKDFDIRRAGMPAPSVEVWVNFEFARAELSAAGREQATKLAEALLTPFLQKWRFELVGHTDRIGSDAINDPLSLQRAETVRQFLVRQGLGANRATAVGRGSREPLRTGNAQGDHAVNRRVQVVLLRGE